MAKRDPRIDAYIAKSADFATPILEHLRGVVHAACPDVEETVKWGSPHFDYKGEMMCAMAAFKQHCAFGFWKGTLVMGKSSSEKGDSAGWLGRITRVSDLPSRKVLTGHIRKAMALNDAGIKAPRMKGPAKKALPVPLDLSLSLKAKQGAPLSLLTALMFAGWPIPALTAQGLPPYASMNPMVNSRSGLASQPYVAPGRRWRVTTLLDYASAIEYAAPPASAAAYLLDAELLRADVTVTRELGKRSFLLGEASVNGAYNGFLDGFIDWYHDLFHFPTGARKIRPRNQFGDSLAIAGGPHLVRGRPGTYLGDVRLGAGFRHSSHWQTLVSATLPTNTGPDGFRRGTVSINAVTTIRSDFGSRFTYEGTLGAGLTPSHGDLAEFQHSAFLMVTQGLRARVAGPMHLYTNVIYHSSLYHDTGTTELDGRELTLDFGGFFKFRRGPEWMVGLTEDLEPSGPAIDVSFRLGARW